mgnify:CR=1 FL=1
MNKTNRRLLKYESMVIDELVSSGYPKESIILEWKLDARRFVDFVVIDVEFVQKNLIVHNLCDDYFLNFFLEEPKKINTNL